VGENTARAGAGITLADARTTIETNSRIQPVKIQTEIQPLRQRD